MLSTSVTFQSGDRELQDLYDTACLRCRENLADFGGTRVLTEGGGYRKIWLETQPMGGEMYAKRDLGAAAANTLLFMRNQRADGRLPGSILCRDGAVVPEFNKLQGFCFPWPALNLYYWLGRDRDYLLRLQDCLERFDAYLWTNRDSDGDGILESWCVYDTGEDNALRYGDAPNYWPGEQAPAGFSAVPMASMDVMSWSYAARDTLAEISDILRDGQTERWRKAARETAAKLRAGLWDEARGALFDRDAGGKTIPILTHNTLRAMYWGAVSPDMAETFVRRHLRNPAEFWTEMPVPSVAVNDPMFRNHPGNDWSGQTQGLTCQRAILALDRYGYEKTATELGKRLMRAVIRAGNRFPQQFDPFTGEPGVVRDPENESAPDGYGPTALAVLEYLARLWGVTRSRDRWQFGLGRAAAPYTYEQEWGGNRYRVESSGREAEVTVNGRRVWQGACGIRLITDEAGNPLGTRELE